VFVSIICSLMMAFAIVGLTGLISRLGCRIKA
jgi:hypothetical protein